MKKKDVPIKNQPKIYPIQALPPFVQDCASRIWKEHGTPKNLAEIVYTFHDGIYTAAQMPQDLFVHECVHFVRQGAGENLELAKEWCERYVVDKEFRYQEEQNI